IYRSYPKQERPFAERGVAYNHRLWTTGHAARERGGAGRLRSGPAAPGYGPEGGVHSLWIRLLIRMWGPRGTPDEPGGPGGGMGAVPGGPLGYSDRATPAGLAAADPAARPG